MWAIHRKPFQHSDILQRLEKWRIDNEWDSHLWLLWSHFGFFKVKSIVDASAGISLPTPLCLEGVEMNTVPFRCLSVKQRRSILSTTPVPVRPERVPLLYHSQDGIPEWREATLDELLASSVYTNTLDYQMCETALALVELPLPHEITLFNAQQCSNPFLVDPTLEHRRYSTKEPLPASVGSGLTTVASQFHYTSLYWEEVDSPSAKAAHLPLPPHCISTSEPIELIHVSQLPEEDQRKLLKTISRTVLLSSLKKPFIFHRTKWVPARTMGLTDLTKNDIPLTDTTGQPLLWVSASLVSTYEGEPSRRYQQVRRFYYNSSQICGSPAPTSYQV